MNDLFRSEWRRFRRLSLAVALCHGVALLLMSRVADVAQLAYDDQAAMLTVYMLLGLTLALLQVGSYRQTSRWLWLIHRPLPPARIFAALALSALAQLVTAILLPLLVFLIATDLMTTQVVDIRHYVALFHALAFAMMAWLAGAHAATSRHKAGVAVLLAPLMLALHLASVWWLLVPVTACLAWLVFIAQHSFRADRGAPIARHSVLLLTALPLQLGFFMLVYQSSKASVALVDLLGRSPGRTRLATDPEVDLDAEMRNISHKFMAQGLAGSHDTRAPQWREQLPLLKTAGVWPDISRFPVRNQLGNVAQPWWDEQRNIKWTFSHDRMQFHGRDMVSGASRGWWGTEGVNSPKKFSEIPASGMTQSTLFAIDAESRTQHELLRLPAGEWFASRPVRALDRVLLLTNKRLLAFRTDRTALSEFAPPVLDWELPLAKGEAVPTVDIDELLDGWLVSLFYSNEQEFDGFESLANQWQQVVFVDANGAATVVGERKDIRDYHVSHSGGLTAVPVTSWWVSPPLYSLAHVPDLLDTGLTQPSHFDLLPRAPLFYPLALGLMLLSVAAGYAWLRGANVGESRRRLWLVSCALLGVPAFLSLVCLEPRGIPVFHSSTWRKRREAIGPA